VCGINHESTNATERKGLHTDMKEYLSLHWHFKAWQKISDVNIEFFVNPDIES